MPFRLEQGTARSMTCPACGEKERQDPKTVLGKARPPSPFTMNA